ncbi:MAG TPA: chemotaxis protein CheX [Firmicutes bacterium]|nr:chemotaxis protein CheX [Bacillota bacterium]HBR29774.1 chemotaxis protein CheX [Bacillota bacterium]HBR33387.1 chemotaxis protein CheX [Bacillota bacterium]
MKAEFINPFVGAAYDIIKMVTQTQASKGELALANSPIRGNEVNVVIGVTGDLAGQIILCMSEATALEFATKMLMNLATETFNELAKSAICELGNMILGNAVTNLGDNGYFCTLTPPTLFIGKDVAVSTQVLRFLVVPLETEFGAITINVALQEKPGKGGY